MPPFKNGVTVVRPHGKMRKDGKPRKGTRYLRISAGPMRGCYVHDLIMEAKLGRKLEGDETVEHQDGDGLNVDLGNLFVVTKRLNTTLRHQREVKARAAAAGEGGIPWTDQF